MTGINIVTRLFIILAVIIVSAISPCTPTISDRRLCFDQLCSVPISVATTVMTYGSNDPDIMSFKSNVEVTVFSKSAGKRKDLWGVEINGKRGYVPSHLLREKKVYKKKLIHDVPTEDIVANTADDSPKKHEANKEKHVPNTLAKAEDTLEQTVAEPAKKTKIISDEATLPSVPVLNQVSPSYEIHDGTTIPLAQNDEPAKPSYATQIPQGIQNIEQQPILSIHPSIASTLTLKTGQIPVDNSVDDAKKYLEVAGLKDQSLSGKIAEEATTELPNESVAQGASFLDVNYTSEANPVNTATNPNTVVDSKTGDATEHANVPSSQESVKKATENDSAKIENENNANNIANDITNTKPKPDISTASLDKQILNEIGNKASQQTLPSDKIPSATVETSTEAAATELPANNAETGKIAAIQDKSVPVVNSNNNFSENTTTKVADNSGPVGHASATEKLAVTEEAEENLSDDEEVEDETEEDDGVDEEADLPEVDANGGQTKDSLPVEQQPAIQEPVEAKPAAEVPPPNNLNIMNPLFNRLSMIPDIVKGIVKKTMSLDHSDQKATGNEKNAIAAEPEANNLDVTENPGNSEPKSPPVDFSTDNNYGNEYQNETNNLKPAAGYSEQDRANTAAENDQKMTGNVENTMAAEPEAENSNVNEISKSSEPRSPPVDFSTNNYVNEYHSETGNSKPAAGYSEQNRANTAAENDKKTTGNVENTMAAEPEAKNSNVNGISKSSEPRSPPVDFTTNNYVYEYQSKTDNSKPAAVYSEQNAANTEVENFGDKFVNNNNSNVDFGRSNDSTADSVETKTSQVSAVEEPVQPGISKEDEIAGFRQDNSAIDETSSFNGFPANRNLLNVGSGLQSDDHNSVVDPSEVFQIQKPTDISDARNGGEAITESLGNEYVPETVEIPAVDNSYIEQATFTETPDSCLLDSNCEKREGNEGNHNFLQQEGEGEQIDEDAGITNSFTTGRNYWETLTYLVVTAFTTLLFSLGYYYIENTRRDGQLIAKINMLEKELLVASKECMVLDDTLKSTKTKLDSIEDESFGSNEMVVSLKTDLEASQAAKSELEDQVSMLEKELESATEAGLELERMLREILSTNNQDNPLAQSVEDLQTRLNAQQAANEALTNALNLKAQENETLTADLVAMTQKCEQLEVEVTRVTEELKHQNNVKSNLEQTLLDKVTQLEKQLKDIAAERINLRKQLKGKEMELKDLLDVVNQMNINNLDFEKLYNVSRVKAEASQLLEERNELQIKLSEVEGAHQLLEEHVKLINEEVSSLSEQCKLAEKSKRDAETRVEVLSNFFKEKEAQRQKEEAVWLQKQGEVSSTVERLHTMQNEIHNYKQQIEMLKREILDQEREYKNQISGLETKSHEHWVIARQNERRLEESKAEAGQLRNRLTLIEKNLNDIDPEAKLHRLEANGETATSPQLFIGAEASSSPIMFTGSSGVPFPPPPSYLYGPPPPPFMPPPTHGSSGIPPYDVGQRPPPLGGRLSSPPPLPGTGSGRYDNPRSPPPPLSPSMLPPFGPPHRAYPPPFANDRIHPPPPPPPHSSMLPPPLGPSTQSWGNETLPPLRNSGFRAHQQHQRDQQRARNHKGSLHSSGESLDKNV